MERKKRQPGASRPLVSIIWAASLIGAAFRFDGAPASAQEPAGPAELSLPSLSSTPSEAGSDAQAAWLQPPNDGSPRDGSRSSLLYDNGAPLDDFGAPASQLSNPPPGTVWTFVAAGADDFELVDYVSPQTNYQITLVRGAFSFYNIPAGETPTPLETWEGIDVVVYANASQGWPNERPEQDGSHSSYNGGPIARQYVPVAALLNETLLGTCRPCYQVDVPVNLVVAKNTKYWLSLIPRFAAPPQMAWSLSSVAGLGLKARRGTSFGTAFWTEIPGNYGCPSATNCPDECDGISNPPAGTNQELSFQLYGQELPPNNGACCDLLAGTCADMAIPENCAGAYKEFSPGILCAFLDPPCDTPLTGACCTESTGSCISGVLVNMCPEDEDHRFAPGLTCAQLAPPCGAGLGACCFPNQHCENLVASACEFAGGVWNEGDCATHLCPPPNDNCADAPVLHGTGFLYFNTFGATTDGPSVTTPGCTGVNQDVWFRYVAPCTGTAVVSLCYGTTFDSALAMYDQCSCPPSEASQIACDDDGCSDSASMMTAPVIAGRCYLIRLGGKAAATGEGILLIDCLPPEQGACCLPQGGCEILDDPTCAALGGVFHADQPCSPLVCPPPNNNCEAAQGIIDGIRHFSTHGATTDGPPVEEPGCSDVNQDIWYDYTASCDGDLIVSLCLDTNYDAALAVYDGWSCSPLGPLVACNDDACYPGGPGEVVISPVTAGHQYKIRIGGAGLSVGTGNLIVACLPPLWGACCLPDGACLEGIEEDCDAVSGTFSLSTPCSPLVCPPPNDLCANALPVTNGSYPFDTRGTGTDGLEDSPGGYCSNVYRDVWFAYTATCDGTLIASLCENADYDAAIAIYSGCETCPPTLLIGCDDNTCGATPVGSAAVTQGACYLIRVGGASEATGTGVLQLDCLPPNTGACCHADYACEILSPEQCTAPDDVFTLGEACSPVNCPLSPLPECCVGDTNGDGIRDGLDISLFVQYLVNQPALGSIEFCRANAEDGDHVLDLTDVVAFANLLLEGGQCEQTLIGACCQEDGGCQLLSTSQCAFSGGSYQGGGTTCDPNPCPPLGACCLEDETCEFLLPDDCIAALGTFQGAGVPCEPNPCVPPPPTCCPGDGTGDYRLDMTDIPLIVEAVLAPPASGTVEFCRADVNEDLIIDGRDLDALTMKLISGEACPPPPNDDCAAALLIECGAQVTLDNALAATEPSDEDFTCFRDGTAAGVGTLWFKFQATDSSARVSTCLSQPPVLDTVIAIYDSAGDCPVSLDSEIACSEDACALLSRVCVSGLLPGNVYYVQVAAHDPASRGLITVDLLCPCPE